MIKYSFLVAVYNVEEYLKKCLDSLLMQDWTEGKYEIILVDDGSTDGSRQICDDYARDFSIIKTVHQENKGLLLTRRTGIENARGEYCIFIDSDDYIEKNMISVIDKRIIQFEPDFLMYSIYVEEGNSSRTVFYTKEDYELVDQEEMLKRFVSTDAYNGVSGKIVKTKILKDNLERIYDRRLNIAEDKIQTAYLIRYSKCMMLTADLLYHYVVRNTSIVKQKDKQDIFDAIYAYARVEGVICETFATLKTEGERDELKELYCISSINAILDHIYKLDWQKRYSRTEKVDILRTVIEDDSSFVTNSYRVKGRLKYYNRIRYGLLKRGCYNSLICLDHFLHIIQSITGTFEKNRKARYV